jgi:hypothetical protein
MRLLNASLAAIGLLVLMSTGVVAQTPSPETTPLTLSAKPDFSSMFIGTWRCSTKSSRRAWSYETVSTTSPSADGYWLVTKSKIAKTPITAAFQSTDMVTYDALARRWVDIETDEQGNYGVTTSSGWHGNTIVWSNAYTPKSTGIASTNPTSITRVSPTEYTSLWSFVESNGRPVTVKTVCNKI